jgi:hypothetical protein
MNARRRLNLPERSKVWAEDQKSAGDQKSAEIKIWRKILSRSGWEKSATTFIAAYEKTLLPRAVKNRPR